MALIFQDEFDHLENEKVKKKKKFTLVERLKMNSENCRPKTEVTQTEQVSTEFFHNVRSYVLYCVCTRAGMFMVTTTRYCLYC